MDYGEILKKSWNIIWKFKVLWIFGFLASCGRGGGSGGGGGGSSQSGNGGGTGANGLNGIQLGEGIERFLHQVEVFFGSISTLDWIMIAVGFLILITAISLIVLALSTIGKTGLILGAWKADAGAEKLRFGELWHESLHYFWRVFLLTIGLNVLGLVVGFMLLFPTILFTIFTLGLGLCCLIPAFIVIAWVLAIFIKQIVVAIVAEDLNIVDGFHRAWQLFRDNFVAYIVMGVIISVGMAVAMVILLSPLFVIFMPIIIGAISLGAQASAAGLLTGGTITLVLLCVYIPVVIVLGAILEAYVGTAWTLVFRRLSGRQGATLGGEKPLPDAGVMAPVVETHAAEEPEGIAEPPAADSGEVQDGGSEDLKQ